MKVAAFIPALLMVFNMLSLPGQTGTVKGFVYEAGSGQTIPLASVTVVGTNLGQATDQNGYFLLTRVPAGPVKIRVSFVGFQDALLDVFVEAGQVQTLTVQMLFGTIELQPATIKAERQRLQKINPVSVHRVTPVGLQRIPGLSGQSDLAEYLQVIPGVIFTGDRGGQFYIRGGEPVNNLVRLDGMTIVSPFHSVGFASVFDTETISSVDINTAGFGSSYGGRLSSVIDVKTRAGNRKAFTSDLSANSFGYNVIAEGPLKKMTEKSPGSVSLLLANKGSYIRSTGRLLYPYLDSAGLPFSYNDLFVKLSMIGSKGDQVDFVGIRATDQALHQGIFDSRWANTAGGARFLISPSQSSMLLESSAYVSDFQATLTEEGSRPRNTHYNSAEGSFRLLYRGPLVSFEWGTELQVIHTAHTFQDITGITVTDEYFTTELVTYLDSHILAGKFLIEPGFRFHYYADKVDFRGEPRLKVKYSVNDCISLNFAGGYYSQNLVSTSSTEDVVTIFQGYYSGPFWIQNSFRGEYIDNKIQLARHAVLGINYLGEETLKLSAEIYLKDYYRMISYNRNKIFPDILRAGTDNGGYQTDPYLTKYFIFEKGLAYGLDLMAEWGFKDANLYISYSLGYVKREDERISYVPHFDRRHNLNLVGGTKLGRKKDWSVKLRWNLGSGFPFTQSTGLYEDLIFKDNSFVPDVKTSGLLQIWYAPINKGRLPWYHRLDISLEKQWNLSHRNKLRLVLGVMNVYNRRNVFYFDRALYERIDQLPILPTIGLTLTL